jgi:hypothetical protein
VVILLLLTIIPDKKRARKIKKIITVREILKDTVGIVIKIMTAMTVIGRRRTVINSDSKLFQSVIIDIKRY